MNQSALPAHPRAGSCVVIGESRGRASPGHDIAHGRSARNRVQYHVIRRMCLIIHWLDGSFTFSGLPLSVFRCKSRRSPQSYLVTDMEQNKSDPEANAQNLTLEDLRDEARRLQNRCLKAAERHYAAEGFWYHLNYYLGVPTVVLAAVAGVIGLLQWEYSGVTAASLSLVVAALALLLTSLEPTRKGDIFHRFAKGYEKLYNRIGYFCRVQSKVKDNDISDLQSSFHRFTKAFNKLNEESPAISLRAQKRAEVNIDRGTGEVVTESEMYGEREETPR